MMRIHGIKLHNVRAIRQLELRDLPETGVVVIHGDNEAGKSTIMDAIHACLNIPHSSNKQEIRALIPADSDQWPEIWLDLEIGPHRVEIYKQFSTSASSKKCELRFPSSARATLRNREADNELAAIIAEHLDSDLLNALFVRQGKLDHTLEAAGITSVETALHAADGGIATGGDMASVEANRSVAHTAADTSTADRSQDESALLAAVNEEYKRYYTEKTAKPAKELKTAEDKLAEAEVACAERQAKVDALASHVSEYEELTRSEKAATAEITAAEQELVSAQQHKDNAQSVQERYDDAVEKVREAEKQKNLESGLLAERSELLEDLKQATKRQDEIAQQLADAEHSERRENEEISRLQEKKQALAADVRHQLSRHKAARKAAQRRHDEQRISELRELTEKAAMIDADITAAREKLAELPAFIDQSAWNSLRQAHDEVVVEQKLAEAQAARLDLQADSPHTVTVDDGATVRTLSLGEVDEAENPSVALSDGMRLSFGGITAVYRSANREAREADSALSAVEKARLHRDELLQHLNCRDFDHAKQVFVRGSEIAEEIAALENQRAGVVGDRDLDSLGQELTRLRETLNDETNDETSENETDLLQKDVDSADAVELSQLSAAELADEVSAAESAEDAARQKLEEVIGELAAFDARPAQREALLLRERYGAAAEHVAEVQAKVAARADDEAMEKLREKVELANLHWQRAIRDRDDALRAVEEVDVQSAVQQWEGAKAHRAHLYDTVHNAKNRKLELSSYIDAATGAAERLHKAESQLAHHKAEYALILRRARAVARLRESLLAHRDAARQRYMAPFARELERFAKVVFDQSVSFELDENLVISKRVIGDTALATDQLSGGAQEQLALLVRFAVAALTARGAHNRDDGDSQQPLIPVPVMVDDALGSTDSRRLRLMATLFSQIARQTQVFVLTCMPERYSRVVGAQNYSMRQLTAEPGKI